jgi:ABC-type uncharacterized transport system permease subunit
MTEIRRFLERYPWVINLGFGVLAVLLALVFTSLVLLIAGADPIQAFENIFNGIFSSSDKMSNVVVSWVPLALVTCGLLITFSAGLWNIGVEGQIVLGAIFTTGAMRLLVETPLAPELVITLSIIAGALGGMLWGWLVGLLRIYGGVSEIFGGLGMNFVAAALAVWLIFGPWKRPGTASMSGTEPFAQRFWLPTLPELRISPWAVAIALVGIVIIYILLRDTRFGLRLRAVGKNPRAASLLGIRTTRYMTMAFLICGAFAGLAGSMQVVAVYHKLLPSISSGYGFLGLLVSMLVNYQALWAPFVALFFAALNIGSIQLPIKMRVDSSLAGVLQGAMVLFVLMMDGVRRKFQNKISASSPEGKGERRG